MRTWGWVVGVVVVLAVVAGATAAPNLLPAQLTLQPADVPGATVASQGPVHEQNYVAAYQRSFTFKSPSGASRIRYVQSESLVAATVARASSALVQVSTAFGSKVGRAAFAVEVAKSLQVKPAAVKLSAPRIPRVGDHAVELPLSVQTSHGRVYESVLYVQLERIVGVFVIAGARPVTASDSRRLATATVLHINKALTPQVYRVPEVTGNAQQGETLTSDTGTWDTNATFAYKWQRCDETASSCTDIPGASSRLYMVAPEDVNFLLRVEVSAANRFGTGVADSSPTGKVTPPPDPGVQ